MGLAEFSHQWSQVFVFFKFVLEHWSSTGTLASSSESRIRSRRLAAIRNYSNDRFAGDARHLMIPTVVMVT